MQVVCFEFFGSPAWIRTTIHGSKGRCPTIRRPGKSAGGTYLPSLTHAGTMRHAGSAGPHKTRKPIPAGAGPGLQTRRALLVTRVGSTPTGFRHIFPLLTIFRRRRAECEHKEKGRDYRRCSNVSARCRALYAPDSVLPMQLRSARIASRTAAFSSIPQRTRSPSIDGFPINSWPSLTSSKHQAASSISGAARDTLAGLFTRAGKSAERQPIVLFEASCLGGLMVVVAAGIFPLAGCVCGICVM